MLLERVEISGFRGIKRLSLTFDDITTLIGENTWGKSSLLDALSKALPVDGQISPFILRDFHLDHASSKAQTTQIDIVLVFRALENTEKKAARYRKLRPLWDEGKDGMARIWYQLSATRQENGVKSECQFLDAHGRIKEIENPYQLATELATLHPILRLRDARRLRADETHEGRGELTQQESSAKHARIERRIHNTTRRLIAMPGHVNKGELKSSMQSMQSLIEHYFSFKRMARQSETPPRDSLFTPAKSRNFNLRQFADREENRASRLMLMGLLNSYLQAKGPLELKRWARPIIIIEDPEGRLHPTHLARAYDVLTLFPMQKILTTNSSDLLTMVPLSSIRRLVKQWHRTEVHSTASQKFSADQMRRIGFHLRFHRAESLFARCWLLVEGETEVWLFHELAAQCGINLASEGVQVVEFAQSGLKSLIKMARAFGIDWHVVTDGDPAGQKYANTVRELLKHDAERMRLTALPAQDIEHFIYQNGFEAFFKGLIKVPLDHQMPAKKVVAKALKKLAKPDLALAIVDYCAEHGVKKIPLLLRKTLLKVVALAKGNTRY